MSGGALLAATRSYFGILNSKFTSNYAGTDSAITAIKTSSAIGFLIYNCLFTQN